MRDVAAVHALRCDCWANGYRPVAVYSPGARLRDGTPIKDAGKRPVTKDWLELARRDPPDAVVRAASSIAANTGIVAGEVSGLDIDVMIAEVVYQIVNRIELTLGPTPLSRIGRAPKTLLCYRAAEPFAKLSTAYYRMPDGSTAHVEILGDGQQFVAFGVHPDTGQHHWLDRSPLHLPLSELPLITVMQARDLVGEAEAILLAAGGVIVQPPKPPRDPAPSRHAQARHSGHERFFRAVNNAALGNIAAWVIALHPSFRDHGNSGWRLSSADLGRNLEEDIAVHPDGIRDFGEETPLTAIDLVISLGAAADPVAAALWLCGQLGIEPMSLGWRDTDPPIVPPPPPPDPPFDRGDVRLTDFFYFMAQHKAIFAPNREIWPLDSLNDRFPKIEVGGGDGSRTIKLKPSVWLARNRPVEQTIWAPDEPTLIRDRLVNEGGWITRRGVTCFNLYLPPPRRPAGDPNKAGPWCDHLARVYPDDRAHIEHFLAHRIQRPGEKINHALLLGGDQGIGKDTLLEPVKRAIGPWNFREATPQQVLGRFNGFVQAIILRISEARDLGERTRRDFYDHMKVYIAAPPDVLRVDEKNLREHAVFNVCAVIETTNYEGGEGLYLPADDRRHYVAQSVCKRTEFDKIYWDNMWNWYNNGGDLHVAAYLASLDLNGFNPKAPPPQTEAFWAIVDAYRAPEDAELADVLETLGNPNLVTLRRILVHVTEDDFRAWLNERGNRRLIPHRFKACGYVAVRNPDAEDGLWKIRARRETVYGKTTLNPSARLAAVYAAVQGRTL
jgi:hypothetical protein